MNVFLTGGSGGLGKIISEQLKIADIKVIKPTSEELNLNGDIDVSSFPSVDGFIHCAGVNPLCSHRDIDPKNLNEIFNINTFSFVNLCSKLKINNGANIIAIGSIYANSVKENRIQYTMSKHALYAAVKTIALEVSHRKIKANMISPGFVDTNLTRKNNGPERIKSLKDNTPLGLVESIDIANLCLFFIKNNNSITGQDIQIDGGYSLKRI